MRGLIAVIYDHVDAVMPLTRIVSALVILAGGGPVEVEAAPPGWRRLRPVARA